MDAISEIARWIDMQGARVVEFRLSAHTTAAWHHHSSMHEVCYCLDGELVIETVECGAVTLGPGERCEVAAGVRHRALNRGGDTCRFLVVQSGGRFDFVVDP